jgi:hypothetical protein
MSDRETIENFITTIRGAFPPPNILGQEADKALAALERLVPPVKFRFGHPMPSVPCAVCGGFKNNQLEQCFLYVVCEDHQNVPPVDIPSSPKR